MKISAFDKMIDQHIQDLAPTTVCKIDGCNQTAAPNMGVCTGCNEAGEPTARNLSELAISLRRQVLATESERVNALYGSELISIDEANELHAAALATFDRVQS